jgi:hypothetical protein
VLAHVLNLPQQSSDEMSVYFISAFLSSVYSDRLSTIYLIVRINK